MFRKLLLASTLLASPAMAATDYPSPTFHTVITPQDVRFYGADPTGVTDSTTAFQNAVTSANCDIIVPPGTYLINGVVTGTQACRLHGAGRGITFIKKGSATGDMFVLAGASLTPGKAWEVSDMTMNANVAQTGGTYIHCKTANCLITRNHIDGAAIGVWIDVGSVVPVVRDLACRNIVPATVFAKSTCILLGGATKPGIEAAIIENVTDFLDLSGAAAQAAAPRSGIEIVNADAPIITNVEIAQNQSNLLIDPANPTVGGTYDANYDQVALSAQFFGGFFDSALTPSGTAYAVEIHPGPKGAVSRIQFNGTWIGDSCASAGALCNGEGLHLEVTAGAYFLTGLTCDNCTFFQNSTYGVNIGANATDIRILGGAMSGNKTCDVISQTGANHWSVDNVTHYSWGATGLIGSPCGFAIGTSNSSVHIADNDLSYQFGASKTTISGVTAWGNNSTPLNPTGGYIINNSGYNGKAGSSITLPASGTNFCSGQSPMTVYIQPNANITGLQTQAVATFWNNTIATVIQLGSGECLQVSYTGGTPPLANVVMH